MSAFKWLIILLVASPVLGTFDFPEKFKLKQSKFEKIIELGLALILNQANEDASQTPLEFRTFALTDDTNEDIGLLKPQEIILRSGYQYEEHYCVSDDGYVTQLIRIINPLADRSKLKQPPVLLAHGGIIDPTVWIWTSSIQHHPEKYPRSVEDGPISSWNRSLAFVLANNGYDVWLAGTRGANKDNQGHVKWKKHLTYQFRGDEFATDRVVDYEEAKQEDQEEKAWSGDFFKYWDFSMDEIAQYEIPKQIDLILELTGAKRISYVVYSLSSQTSLAMLSSRPEYHEKIHNYVVFAPIISDVGSNTFLLAVHELFRNLPLQLGHMISQIVFSQETRNLFLRFNIDRKLRYTLCKHTIRTLCGPSPKYLASMEPAIVGNTFKSVGFKELKHYAQQSRARRLQHFDYGPVANQARYGSIFPPPYELGHIKLRDYFLVTGKNDKMAPPDSTKLMLNTFGTKPYRHIDLDMYNHVDLTTAFDNDIRINLPLLEYFERFQLAPLDLSHQSTFRSSAAKINSISADQYPAPDAQAPSQTKSLESHMRRASFGPPPSAYMRSEAAAYNQTVFA